MFQKAALFCYTELPANLKLSCWFLHSPLGLLKYGYWSKILVGGLLAQYTPNFSSKTGGLSWVGPPLRPILFKRHCFPTHPATGNHVLALLLLQLQLLLLLFMGRGHGSVEENLLGM